MLNRADRSNRSIAPLLPFGGLRVMNRVEIASSESRTPISRVIVLMDESNRLKRGTGAPRSHPASFPRPSEQRFQAGSVDRLNTRLIPGIVMLLTRRGRRSKKASPGQI